MAFYTIITNTGQAKIANAVALGQQLQVTEMALGDGNGNATTPVQTQTGLVRQVYRAQLNQLSVDSANPNYIIAELVVPSEAGGWTVREIGLYDVDGSLIAVGNFPETYKPQLSEGASRDLVVRIIIEVSNASVVQLKIDPSVVLASRAWVVSNFLMRNKVAGGTVGQILAKKSNTDEDFEWKDPTSAVNVLVDVKPERQTLAAAQTVVNYATIVASGISVYAEGVRLIETIDYTVTGAAQITLAQAYPAGTILHSYQNEALDSIAGATETIRGLVRMSTQAQVTAGNDATTAVSPARLKAALDALGAILTPAGAVQAFARPTPPNGWLKCNGAAVSRSTYNTLFAAIGTAFGVGDGSSTFNLPDLRGEFVRGLDDGRGVDAGRIFASAQADEMKSHTHLSPNGVNPATGSLYEIPQATIRYDEYDYNPAVPTSATGGTETRPRNIALLYCIKA